MNCTQKQQLVCFPKVRVYKPWFRHFNDHKDFRNEGTVHLFSLMALFSYANFRSNERVIYGDRYMEAPGQWICKLGALPRILRVHSKAQALELMEYFRNHGFLTFEILDEEKEILRFTIADWKEHCTHLQYIVNTLTPNLVLATSHLPILLDIDRFPILILLAFEPFIRRGMLPSLLREPASAWPWQKWSKRSWLSAVSVIVGAVLP